MDGDDWINAALKIVRELMRRYPAGTIVWHKADGVRMVVDGWKIAGDGQALLSVSTGANSGNCVFAFEVSAIPIPEDGEEWKSGPGE